MKVTYEVTSKVTGKTVKVEACSEESALRKAAKLLTGKSQKGLITWHGKHAEIGGLGRYSRPAAVTP